MKKISLNNQNFSFRHAFSRISCLAIPMALSYTFSFSVVAVGILAGYLNHDAPHVAAVTLTMTTMNTFVIIGLSPLFAMSIVASYQIGDLKKSEREGEDIRKLEEKRLSISSVNKNGLLISAFVSPIIFFLMFFSKNILIHIFGQSAEVASIAQDFLRIYSFAVPGVMIRICFEQMMFSFGRVNPAMLIGLVNFSIGTLLAAWFGFGGFGLSGLGLSGIAFGYVIEAYLTALAYGLYIARHKDFHQFRFFHLSKNIGENNTQLREILKIGGPISFTVTNEMITTFVIGILAGLVGTLELAALNFAMQFVFFTFIALAAFGQACCQEVSREVGAKHYENAHYLAKYGLLTTLIFIAPFCLIVAIAPNLLMAIVHNHNENIRSIIKFLVPIIAAAVFLDSIRYNLIQVLRALNDHIYSTIASTLSLWFGIVLAGILGLGTSMGIYGIGLGYLLGILLGVISLLVQWVIRIQPNIIKKTFYN